MRFWILSPVLLMLLWQSAPASDRSQSNSPFPPPPGALPPVPEGGGDFYSPHPPMLVRDFAWSFVDTPKPTEVKVHDIITVTVKEASQTQATSTYNRQRNGQFTAQLAQFIRINAQGNLDTAATQSPEIDGELQSRLQS